MILDSLLRFEHLKSLLSKLSKTIGYVEIFKVSFLEKSY